jgi:Cu(I)/Ag(I) efflux system membrane fusion protein
MGMDYIAVYEDDAPDDSGAVKVSPARIQTLGVKTAEPRNAPWTRPCAPSAG